jgi:hypothetical protein
MDYGKILTKAWQIIWKYKILWLFGFLSNCGRNAGGSSTANSGNPNVNFSFSGGSGNLPAGIERFFNNLEYFFQQHSEQFAFWFVILLIVILLLTALTFFVRVYGQVGLVRGILKADGEAPASLSFNEIHDEVGPFYWRLAGFHLLLFFASLVLVLILILPLILLTIVTVGIAMICIIPLICLAIPVWWALWIIIQQAIIAMLVDDLDIGTALRRGWDVVRTHPAEYLVMGLILLIGGGILGLIFSLPQIFAIAPLIAPMLGGITSDNWQGLTTGLWLSVACLVAYWPVLAVLRGALRAYVDSAWVLTYLENSQGSEDKEAKPETPELPEPPEPELETA